MGPAKFEEMAQTKEVRVAQPGCPLSRNKVSSFIMIEIVSATRMTQGDFWNKSPLGLSLKRLANDTRLAPYIVYENQRGLPEIFNGRITAQTRYEILVFVHDDVWIDDYFLADRVIEGLKTYDVIGVAGNRRRVKNQPAWAFKSLLDGKFTWDEKANLSGSVAHGTHPFGAISCYGSVPAECELLDGAFLAAKKSPLTDHGAVFDPEFDFHFYDMDFCRCARKNGLRLGTWPICLTHQSSGGFNSPTWHDKLRLYQKKWEVET